MIPLPSAPCPGTNVFILYTALGANTGSLFFKGKLLGLAKQFSEKNFFDVWHCNSQMRECASPTDASQPVDMAVTLLT
jgi:hypothetical protein